ncbi:MAG TPA: N-acetylmuramoyl-L-alanine amidase [Negativicutes bacterium]|nr:N-acetylmuramoyl-L-alanine amidase [Negativicutes bacterium]
MAVSSVGFAAKASTSPKAADQPGSRLLAAVRTAGASTGPGEQLTQIRWANHIDAVTGAGRLRIVIDTTGPVQVSSSVSAMPTPRLIVNVKGAVPGQTDCDLNLDGKLADRIVMKSDDDRNTTVVVEMPLTPEDGDYRVFTLPQDVANKKPFRVVIDVNQPLPPVNFTFTPGLKDKLIVLDPGHGGSDPGAVGLSGMTEKEVNLAVAMRVKDLLDKAGAKVVMTHQDDRDVFGPNASAVDELKARATIANFKKADIFVSIHSNAALNRDADGTTTYYFPKSRYDSLLARNLQNGMLQTAGLKDKGFLTANFYVIKRTVMPASLVELAFLSNPNEERLLANPQFQQKMAEGIVQGMDRFFAQAAQMGGGR